MQDFSSHAQKRCQKSGLKKKKVKPRKDLPHTRDFFFCFNRKNCLQGPDGFPVVQP